MTRLLIVGAGDIARRIFPLLRSTHRVAVLVRRPGAAADWRARGARVVTGDLDRRESLARLSGWSGSVIHLAPPPDMGLRDTRTSHLLAALESAPTLPQRLVYLSTTGVYGDHGGARIDECAAQRATTGRALRRRDAERQLRAFGRRSGVPVTILRAPGIYAADRLPLARLRAGSPALAPAADVFTNHVHADDLARAVVAAMRRGRACRAYNVSDDDEMRMGDYFDQVAMATGLPKPPRVSRAEAARKLTPAMLSYLGESRRTSNHRLKAELGLTLRYPTLADGLVALKTATPC